MPQTISQEELSDVAASGVIGKKTLFIEKDGARVAAIISMDEYESTHEAKVERLIAAMDEFGDHMASAATPEELVELERELDRHNR